MKCPHFDAHRCRSCSLLATPVEQQLEQKQAQLSAHLEPFTVQQWCTPVSGPESGFRNKAKMVVAGAAHQPILGIMSPDGEAVSLTDCPLYPSDMQRLLQRLERFVRQAGIPPYNVAKKKGELKFILLTRSELRGEYMLRFVMRSDQAIGRIQRELPALLAEWPTISVVSVNLQPVHMAILEGEQEIFLSEHTRLEERFNDVPLFIRPKSFFQTNPTVASQLYRTAKEWLSPLKASTIWDLFCGVGGFGLHCANHDTQLTGIEIEAEAIACASLSASRLGLENVTFRALDSTTFGTDTGSVQKPDVVIVNPPRRGIGAALAQALNTYQPPTLLYSSCNAASLAQDLVYLSNYEIARVQLFDMFPHSEHFEVLTLLTRKTSN